MAIWDDVIPPEDIRMFNKGEMGGKMRYGEKPAIIVVDMQQGFILDEYPLGCSKMGLPTAHSIKKLLDKGREMGIPIFFSKYSVGKTPAERGRWKHLRSLERKVFEDEEYQKAFDPREYKIFELLEPKDNEVVVTKIHPSAFFDTHLATMLIFHNVDTVIVTGMVTSGCVRATVVDAFSYNFAVIVPEECVGDRGVISHKVSLFDMHMKYADVLSLAEVIGFLDSLKKQG